MTGRLGAATALITGGGRGLGAAVCETLAEAGATVVVADFRRELAEAQCGRMKERGLAASFYPLDVRDDRSVEACVANVFDRHQHLDILVNNAAVDFTKPLDELSVDEWDQVIDTNLRGPMLLCRSVLPHMKQRRRGHIINITSTAAKRSWPNASAYHASKWGLLGFSHALHAELRPHGIKVTAIVASGMRTPFLLERFPDIDPSLLQDPATVAAAVLDVLCLPGESVIPEITVLPMRETSWP
jgi:NAD(P)-dependent dehydrogenase (short-subunit alcohol dehydrogenase family)